MNQKYIITGAPGTGKTAIINALMQKDYSCAEEISREIIAEQIMIGGDILPWKNQIAFENHIASLRKEQYLNSSENENYFFDRSSIDCIAYLKANRLGITTEITQIIKQCLARTSLKRNSVTLLKNALSSTMNKKREDSQTHFQLSSQKEHLFHQCLLS